MAATGNTFEFGRICVSLTLLLIWVALISSMVWEVAEASFICPVHRCHYRECGCGYPRQRPVCW